MFFGCTFTLLFSNLTAVNSGAPITVYSQLGCSSMCLDRENCTSFFYNPDRKACIGSSARYHSTTGLTEGEGYLYYITRPDCDHDWTVICGQCYQHVNLKMSALNAKTECEKRGGFLAKTDSAVDNTIIRNIVKMHGNVWIGGVDEAEDGNWSWRDGSPISFGYWASAQPDNGPDYCLEQWPGGWNNGNCNVKQNFLCEK